MASVPRITAPDADLAYAAGQKVVEVHRRLSSWLRPAMTLPQIDEFVAKTLEALDCQSCFYGYVVPGHPRFPSHACLSLNDCVVHGHAAYYREPIKPGDLLKIDIGVWHRGWVGDAAWTYSIGEPSPANRRLMESGKVSLARGVEKLRAGARYLDWAVEVQDCVEKEYGFHCILNWGGHGIGKRKSDKDRGLHLPPHLLNHRPADSASWPEARHTWQPGNLIAVEPMIAVGTGQTVQQPFPYGGNLTDWPVYTADASMSVHYEHDVLITESGPRVMTEGLEHTPDVIAV